MEITVIDESDHVGWLAAATRTEEIYMTSVSSMVTNVLAAWRRRQPYRRTCSPSHRAAMIDRLNVLDHGNSSSLQIGSDRISTTSLPGFEPTLARLRGHFSSSGFVHLQHCNVGSNRALMLALACAFDTIVYAGTGAHNPIYRFNFGDYVRATPGGSYSVGVARP